MRILGLETAGIRGLRDASWTLLPERGGAGHLTVVTGPPSSGLTTFLDAIALTAARLAVGGTVPSSEDALRAGARSAAIRSTWQLDSEERAQGGLLEETTPAEVIFTRGAVPRADADPALIGAMSRYDHQPSTSKVVLFPARRITDGAFPAFSDFEVDQRFKHLSSQPDKFAGLPYAVVKHAAGRGERARFDDVQRLFVELCDSARILGVTSTGQLEFGIGNGPRVSLSQLGFAERNAFVLAAMPVLMGLHRSVVLLDTPDLGLAPGMAARWMDVLRGYAPEAQWIVASRDPALVAMVDPACRIELSRGAA